MIHPYIYAGLPTKVNIKIDEESLALVISNFYELDFYKFKNNTSWRKREYVIARQIFFYIMRKKTKKSLSDIGKFFNKDHATVIHSINEVDKFLEIDASFRKEVQEIKIKFKNHLAY